VGVHTVLSFTFDFCPTAVPIQLNGRESGPASAPKMRSCIGRTAVVSADTRRRAGGSTALTRHTKQSAEHIPRSAWVQRVQGTAERRWVKHIAVVGGLGLLSSVRARVRCYGRVASGEEEET
jgi:hypothetical protein